MKVCALAHCGLLEDSRGVSCSPLPRQGPRGPSTVGKRVSSLETCNYSLNKASKGKDHSGDHTEHTQADDEEFLSSPLSVLRLVYYKSQVGTRLFGGLGAFAVTSVTRFPFYPL